MRSVLFVCSGNTCRSPMAEAIMADLIEDHPTLGGLEVRSAGTFACEGARMSEYAEKALQELGIKPRRHRASPLTPELLDNSDLILTMQEQHLEEINALSPDSQDKAHTLKGYVEGVSGFDASGDYDIPDPYFQPLEVYVECAQDLKSCIELLIKKLEHQAT